MAFAWSAALVVGVDEIDSQHAELFCRINALLVAMQEGHGRAEVEKTLYFLEDYIETHFGAEERLMVKHGYPSQAAAAHRKEHSEFIRAFDDIKYELHQEGPTAALVLKVERSLCDWLLSHIGKTDLELGSFLRTKQRGVSRSF